MNDEQLEKYIKDKNPRQTLTNELRWVADFDRGFTKLQQKWLVQICGWGETYDEEVWRDVPIILNDQVYAE